LPLRPDDRIDIIPADYAGKAIVAIHQKEKATHNTYHLSSGTGSQTYRELTDALAKNGGWRKPLYVSSLGARSPAPVKLACPKKRAIWDAARLFSRYSGLT